MKVRPLHDRVLIKRVGSSETTTGGIIIPDAERSSRAWDSKSKQPLPSAKRLAAYCERAGDGRSSQPEPIPWNCTLRSMRYSRSMDHNMNALSKHLRAPFS